MAPTLGLDVGETRLLAVVCDTDQRVMHKACYRMARHSEPNACASLLLRAYDDAQAADANPQAIGIGLPGLIDSHRGIVRRSTLSDRWQNVRLTAAIAAASGLPTAIDTRVNNAARAEVSLRSEQDSFLFLSGSRQVHGAVVLAGEVWPGINGLAGLIGHRPLPADCPECVCGSDRCSAAFASSAGIASRLGITTSNLTSFLQRFPDRCARALSESGEALGRTLGDVLNVLNPELVVIGGHLAAYSAWRAALELAARNAAIDEVQSACRFEVSRAGRDGRGIGAALVAREILLPRSAREAAA